MLLGVLAVTLIALVAFDVAAVTALRGYLMGQTDQQLQEVLSLYRVLPVHETRSGTAQPGSVMPPGISPGASSGSEITGPRAILPGALGQFDVVTVNRQQAAALDHGWSSAAAPDAPPEPDRNWPEAHTAVTLTGRDGTTQIRLMAVAFPGHGLVVRHAPACPGCSVPSASLSSS